MWYEDKEGRRQTEMLALYRRIGFVPLTRSFINIDRDGIIGRADLYQRLSEIFDHPDKPSEILRTTHPLLPDAQPRDDSDDDLLIIPPFKKTSSSPN